MGDAGKPVSAVAPRLKMGHVSINRETDLISVWAKSEGVDVPDGGT